MFGCSEKYDSGPYENLEARNVEFKEVTYDVVSFDPAVLKLELFWKDESGKAYRNFASLKDKLLSEKQELMFAANAGIYTADYSPGGLHIEKGEEISGINLSEGEGNFHMMPNGVFLVSESGASVVKSSAFQNLNEKVRIASQSGPMLVIDDQIHPEFTDGSKNRHIRSGVGVDKEGKIHFAISGKVVNFYDFASFFKEELGCPNALYLDGKISRFYAPKIALENTGGDFVGIFAIATKQ